MTSGPLHNVASATGTDPGGNYIDSLEDSLTIGTPVPVQEDDVDILPVTGSVLRQSGLLVTAAGLVGGGVLPLVRPFSAVTGARRGE